METRLSLIWVGLLGIVESTDVLTTAADRARGSIESMPISAAVLDTGGLPLFVTLKAALVVAAAVAMLLALRWLRSRRSSARAVYVFVLSAVRMASVVLALACLNNAVLLRSLG